MTHCDISRQNLYFRSPRLALSLSNDNCSHWLSKSVRAPLVVVVVGLLESRVSHIYTQQTVNNINMDLYRSRIYTLCTCRRYPLMRQAVKLDEVTSRMLTVLNSSCGCFCGADELIIIYFWINCQILVSVFAGLKRPKPINCIALC